jgi:DNA-binding NarL/FixJ family response regulator
MPDMGNAEEIVAYAALVKRLTEWRDQWRAVNDARDELIKEAHADGMSNMQIAANMGIARGTVISVLGNDSEGG